MSTNRNANEVPEVPAELLNRRPVALTAYAAEAEGLDTICVPDNEAGITRQSVRPQQIRFNERQIEAINELCSAPAGFEPAAGMPAKAVMEIMGRNYPDAPKQDPFFGDRTPEFICWLYENHPVEAHIRYLSRLMPDAGRWIAKNHPKFVYVPGKRVAIPGRGVPRGYDLNTDIIATETTSPKDSPEVTALKARIAELEAKTQPTKKTRGKAKAKPAKTIPATQPN